MKKTFLVGVVFTMMAAGPASLAANYGRRTLLAQNTSNSSADTANGVDATNSQSTKRKKKTVTSNRARTSRTVRAQSTRYRQRSSVQNMALARRSNSRTSTVKKAAYKTTTATSRQAQLAAQQQAQQNDPNDLQMSPVAPAPAVTTTVKKTNPESKTGTWGFKYRSNNAIMLNALEAPEAGGLDHEIAAWDRVNVTYHLNDNVSVDFMPQFYHTWFGNRDRLQNPSIPELQQPYSGYMGETGLGVVDSKLAQLAGGLTLDGYAGYFFPTAEWEQLAGTVGAARVNLGLGRSIGKLDVKWIESLWYYFERYQTSSVYDTGTNWNPATGGPVDPTQPARAPMPVQNVQYNVWSLLDMTYNFSKKFYFDFTSGFMNASAYADNNPATARPAVLNDYIIMDPEIGYTFSKNFALSLGLWEEADMRNQPLPYYVPFNGATGNTQFYFMTTVTL